METQYLTRRVTNPRFQFEIGLVKSTREREREREGGRGCELLLKEQEEGLRGKREKWTKSLVRSSAAAPQGHPSSQ